MYSGDIYFGIYNYADINAVKMSHIDRNTVKWVRYIFEFKSRLIYYGNYWCKNFGNQKAERINPRETFRFVKY